MAIRYFREALKLSEPEDKDEIYLDLAMEFQNQSDYANAIVILLEAIKYNPNNEAAIYEIAYCYDQSAEYEKAIQCYSDFIDENPYSFTAWYNLGNAYSKLENWEKAIWAYDFCVVINEDFSPAYFNLGNAYLSMDKYMLSIENFEQCMKLDGEDGLALCYIGECYEQLGNYDIAKIYYHKSLKLFPHLPEAWLGLGIVCDLEGNTREGINLIEKAISLAPENGSFYHVLAGAFEKIEAWEDAENAYLMALELDPNNEEALCDFIEFQIDLMKFNESLDFLTTFDAPENLRIIVCLLKANLCWILNRQQETIELLIPCIAEDEEKSKEIFTLYPALKNEVKIVNLFSI
jgi:tetratricopeptide (TPR) repeat protein